MISVSLFSWLEPVPVLSLSSLRIVSLLNPSSLHTQTHRRPTTFMPEQDSKVLIRAKWTRQNNCSEQGHTLNLTLTAQNRVTP